MRPFVKNFLATGMMILFFCTIPDLVKAQGQVFTDPDTPIDGGVSILVAAGVAYGAKKIRDERKKKLDKLQ